MCFRTTVFLETGGPWLVWWPHQQPQFPYFSENIVYHHGYMSLKRWIPTSILKSIGHPKQEKEERWRRERGRKRKKGKGGGRKGKRTKCDIWKLLVFPAGFQLCLLYCHVIVSNSKEDWEIFLDKHIASLNKIKVLCVRKKKKTYSR